MTFNILQGGAEARNVGFANTLFGGSRIDEVADVIRLARADVVGVQEDCGSDALLEALGPDWHRIGSVYTRLPMTKVTTAPFLTVVRLEVPGSKSITLVNCHWMPPPNRYGPDLAQRELRADPAVTAPTAMADRIATACATPDGPRGYRATLEPVQKAIGADEPTILTGDFNEPSHLDWSDAYARSGVDRWVENPTGTPLRFAVAWPGSILLEEVGLDDSYRGVHPDEVKRPGHTWTPAYPAHTPGRRPYGDQCLVRIDRIHHSPKHLTPVEAHVIGGKEAEADVVYEGRWPSDHRAVVVAFTWRE